MAPYDHVIVGSGINGLVCAGVLATRGRRVCVLERNDRLGGCIRTEEATVPGFRHDVLSGWHPLFVGSPGYAELGRRLEENGLEYCNTDQPTAVVLPDDRCLVWWRSREANAEVMEELARGDGERYRRSMAEFETTLDVTSTLFGSELWTRATARSLAGALWRMGPGGLAGYLGASLEDARSWLEATFRAEETRAILAPWPSHAGMSLESAASGPMVRLRWPSPWRRSAARWSRAVASAWSRPSGASSRRTAGSSTSGPTSSGC